MSREFRFQDPGEGIHEAEIVEVRVAAGDRVDEGDVVLAVETDKATTEIPSPYSGTIDQIAVEPGDLVRVGDLLLSFDEGEAEGPQPEPEKQGRSERPADRTSDLPSDRPSDRVPAQREPARERPESRSSRPPPQPQPVPAAPSTRRLARELGVALDEVAGSGPGGRVLAEDVRAFSDRDERSAAARSPEQDRREAEQAKAAPKRQEGPRETGDEGYRLPDFTRWGEIERVPLKSVRRTTAREMARSWARIPHVMHFDRADITDLERLRRGHEAEVAEVGGKLTMTVLVLKAAVAALKAFPRFNASLDADDESLVLKHYYHLGVATATEQGLLVPVLRDVDRKSIRDLAVELVALAERARQGEAKLEELQGGTFTITNVGGLGGVLFTPIIRHPEAAILGLGRIDLEPVATGDSEDFALTARLRLPLCLAFDHRINDGAEAAGFMNHLIRSLQDPEALLLSV